jgi:hypothetical protein
MGFGWLRGSRSCNRGPPVHRLEARLQTGVGIYRCGSRLPVMRFTGG